MLALTVIPGRARSGLLAQVPEPPPEHGAILVQTHAIGVCRTDLDILDGRYGQAPEGETRLVIGHESIGRVLSAPAGGALREGDWVVGIVRRPDPVPCASCRVGEWDMCRNGRYLERGIKGLPGFASERYRLSPEFAVGVDPQLGELGVLLEPASVVAKAWEHIERIGRRAHFAPERVLVTGAGPIGLLAALLGCQRGLRVSVFDRTTDGPKPGLVSDLGASYHVRDLDALCHEADIVLECTGAPAVIFAAIEHTLPGGIVCLTGLSSGGHTLAIDIGALNRQLVLENSVVFGSVNARRVHYEQAALALAEADPAWLARLITRKVPLDRWPQALQRRPTDVKGVIVFDSASA